MARLPMVLVHGYSAGPRAFDRWRDVFEGMGYPQESLLACHYQSLVHRVTLKDVGEAFEHALAMHPRLDEGARFDAVVHSTGMLVIRAWMALDPERNRPRVRRLVALAPATFGSPLAHKGRGYLAKMIKGNREAGEDFLAVGDEILDGLELGSRFTWELAQHDLVGEKAAALAAIDGPHTFVLCGIDGYKGLVGLVNEPGTDGTVRLAGAALNSRMIELDLRPSAGGLDAKRTVTAPWSKPDVPVIALAGQNHGTIMQAPSDKAIELVSRALNVDDDAAYAAWCDDASAHSKRVIRTAIDAGRLHEWQQFVFRVVDERDDPVTDYYVDFVYRDPGQVRWRVLDGVKMHVHPYGRDASLRCFHVRLDTLPSATEAQLGLRLIAEAGTSRIEYHGYTSESVVMLSGIESEADRKAWTAAIDLAELEEITLFYAFTTTLVELRIDRAPRPFEVVRFEGVTPEAISAHRLAQRHAKDAEHQAELEAALHQLLEDARR